MRSIIIKLCQIIITVFVLSSCEREWTSPYDSNYKLNPPTLLSVEPLTDTNIETTWKNNDDYFTGFVIYRKSGSGIFNLQAALPDTHFSYIDGNCELGIEYTYMVRSKLETNLSGNSNVLSGTTSFPAPSVLSVNLLNDIEIQLTWTDNSNYENGFKIERDSGSGFSEIATVSADVTAFSDSGLSPGQSYNYRVAAYTSANTSSWAVIAAATEFSTPSNLSAVGVSDSEIQLTWTDNTDYETGFKIERDSGSGFAEIATVSVDVTEYLDTGLTYGETYAYRVAAYTVGVTSDFSPATVAIAEFPAPSDFSATGVSDSELRLTWTDNTGYETGFKIERDSGSGFSEIAIVSADVTQFTDTGLTYGETYGYRVAAYLSGNTSSWATTTARTEFPGLYGLSATSFSDSELMLTWTDNCSYESGFKIERDSGSGRIEIATVSEDVTEFIDTGLIYGVTYYYHVAAYTATNTSSWNWVIAAIEFPAPTNLSAIGVSDTEIRLNWTDNTSFETGFTIERDGGSGFTVLGYSTSDVTEFIDDGLNYGQSFQYRVSAYTPNITSSYSDLATGYVCSNCVVDFDGNIYETIQIGDQVWMAENLKVTHFRDGTSITNVSGNATWSELTTEAYCIYNNNESNEIDNYGALYNWFAVTDYRNIAPEGWHVPDLGERIALKIYLTNNGHSGTEGDALKSTSGWDYDGNGTDDYEFTAVPSGNRNPFSGAFLDLGSRHNFWTSNAMSNDYAYDGKLTASFSGITESIADKRSGFSVRCLRD